MDLKVPEVVKMHVLRSFTYSVFNLNRRPDGYKLTPSKPPAQAPSNINRTIIEVYQRGLSEARNGYGFGMIPGHGPPDVNLSSLALDGSPACKLFIAPKLERLMSGRPCLMGCGMNPTFHSQMSTADQQLHQITWFLMFWCSCDRQISLKNKWGKKTQWLVRCRILVLSLRKKAAKGVPKWAKNRPSPNLSFNIQFHLAT